MNQQEKEKPLVEVIDLTKNYGRRPALQGVNLELRPGHIIGLMGENGCGKTTLLKILAGVLQPTSGNVSICGNPPSPQTKAEVAFLPDASLLEDGIRGREAIAQYADFFTDFDSQKAREMLRFFGIDESLRCRELSKGMREKLQIALVMGRDAKVFLLDEPISGVDPASREVILNGIVKGFQPDSVMLLSTHLITDIEMIVDQAVFMRNGRILLHRDAEDIRENEGKSIDELFRQIYRYQGE